MKQVSLGKQRGVSLTGLIVILIVLGMFGMLAAQVAPTFMEYRAITKAIAVAKDTGHTVSEIQQSFNKQCDVNYITSITGKDLEISKESGQFEVSFEYQKKIHLVGPASLVLDYAGTTAPAGAKTPKQ